MVPGLAWAPSRIHDSVPQIAVELGRHAAAELGPSCRLRNWPHAVLDEISQTPDTSIPRRLGFGPPLTARAD